MGVTDPCDGMVFDPFDKSPDTPVPDSTFISTGIAKRRQPDGSPCLISLHDACTKGNTEEMQSLLDQGANINGRDANHDTALLAALKNGKLEVAKALIKHGADANCRSKTGWTPLMLASKSGHRNISELLLDNGADVNAKREDLWTALHLASRNGHMEIVKDLLDRCGDIHARNINGHTPSGEASRGAFESRDIVQLLSGMKANSLVVWAPSLSFPLLSVILIPFISI
jgi:ankyrin repeat protein